MLFGFVHLKKQTNLLTNTIIMTDIQREIVQKSINPNLIDIMQWFELATDKQINRDSEDWAILEKDILNLLIKNSN